MDSSLLSVNMSSGSSSSFLNTSTDSSSPEPYGGQNFRDWSSLLRKAEDEDGKSVIINDSIHGHIVVPAVCQAVIDTPQFDRLRGLRQVGSAHYVYPCAKHSRWEHSLGVMHLAGQFLEHLRLLRPNCADEKDQLCVMLAGLCHDLGHGPFSHLWETFVSEARPGFQWHHEETSIEMLDFIIQENNLLPVFEQHGLSETDVTFVKELIFGPLQSGGDSQGSTGDYPYKGRGPHKFFLYEIVANKISSIDVDKWDYFLRDNAAMKIGVTFDYKRFILFSDIMEHEGRTRLVIRDKEAESVQEMFLDRVRLHRKGYQHKVIKIVDRMLIDSLLLADTHLDLIYDRLGNPCRLSAACEDMFSFSQLTDEYLIKSIQFSRKEALNPAREIITRITKRNLYKLIGIVKFSCPMPESVEILEKELREQVDKQVQQQEVVSEGALLCGGDVAIIRGKINMGMGRLNPVERVLFFDKRGRCHSYSSDQLKMILPEEIHTESLVVVCRSQEDNNHDLLRKTFRNWATERFRGLKGCSVKLCDKKKI